MTRSDPIPVLNRLLPLLWRSLPSYLADTRPRPGRGPEELHEAICQIAAEQHLLAGEIVEAIRRLGGLPHYGRFPIRFTAINDLALPFLAGQVIRSAQLQRESIAQAASQLEDWPRLKRLAERIGETLQAQTRFLQERLDHQPATGG